MTTIRLNFKGVPRKRRSSHAPDGNVRHARSDALRFLKVLLQDGLLALTAIDPADGAQSKTCTMTFEQGEEKAMLAWLEGRAEEELNLYYQGNPVSRRISKKARKTDIECVTTLHVDIDPSGAAMKPGAARTRWKNAKIEELKTFKPQPTAIMNSGNGLQAIWHLRQPMRDFARAEEINRCLAASLGAQPGTDDVSRLLRIPGYVNLPDKRKRAKGYVTTKAQLLLLRESTTHGLSAFKDFTESAAKQRGTRPPLKEATDRSRVLFHIACEHQRQGKEWEQFLAAAWANPHAASHLRDHSDEDHALRRAWEGAREAVSSEATANGAVVLNTRDPTTCARLLLQSRFAATPLVYYRSEFLRYRDGSYRSVEDRAIRAEISEFIDSAVSQNGGGRCIPTRHNIAEIADALASLVHLDGERDLPLWLQEDASFKANEIIAFRNGLLHWPSRKFIPPSSDFVTRNAVAFDYDPEAPSPERWKSFLRDIWPDDMAARSLLAEIVGYILSGDTRQQKMFLWDSPSRGGKGTAAHIIGKLVGELNICAPTLSNLSSEFGLQPLLGKQIAVISDVRDGRVADKSAITENLLRITGEDRVTVNRKGRDQLTVLLPTRFLLLSNEAPDLRDASGAIANRLVILSSKQSFLGKEDTNLRHALEQELPGILNWALRGLDRLHMRGQFREPKSSQLMRGQVGALGSPIKAFVADRCVLESDGSVEKQALFREWCDWCEDRNYKAVGDETQFARKLYAFSATIGDTRPRKNGKREQRYTGIRLADRN